MYFVASMCIVMLIILMHVENSLIIKQVNEFSLIAKNIYTYIGQFSKL
jgi:hypothetical protein